MQRIWVSKPDEELIELMNESIDKTLYMVSQNGPLSFTFKDENGDKFTTMIGENIKCSCTQTKQMKKHCIHTIYVLNRIFKISFKNQLIYQIQFNESELNKIINIKQEEGIMKKSENLKLKNNKNIQDKIKKSSNKELPLSEDTTCVICQEDMYSIENLNPCLFCGRHFHFRCLNIWVDHKLSSYEKVSCPMCRNQWNTEYINNFKLIAGEKETKENKLQKLKYKNTNHSTNCNECSRTNIKYQRYHCINCNCYDLCSECFNDHNHNKSHIFISKKEDKWFGISDRVSSILISNKLSQFLIETLLLNPNNNLNNEEDILMKQCCICGSSKTSKLYLLTFKYLPLCNHPVHIKCAEILFNITNKANTLEVGILFNKCRHCNINKQNDSLIYIYPGLMTIGLKMSNLTLRDKTIRSKSNSAFGIAKKKTIENIIPEIKKLNSNKLTPIGKYTPSIFNGMTIIPSKPHNLDDFLNIQRINFNNNTGNLHLPQIKDKTIKQSNSKLPKIEQVKKNKEDLIKINTKVIDLSLGIRMSPVFN